MLLKSTTLPSRPRRDSVRSVRQVAESLSPSTWQTLRLRDGAKGPLAFEFAAVRVWQVHHRKPGPPSWLLIRRSLEPKPEVKYYISNADAHVPLCPLCPLRTLAQVTGGDKSHLWALARGGTLRRMQRIPGHGALRSPCLD